MKNTEGEIIIEEAKQFMKNRIKASWADYNIFKQRLIAAKCYGYEKLLADILNV